MTSKLALALGVSIVFAGYSAHAQSQDTATPGVTNDTTSSSSRPPDWNDELRNTFFSDTDMWTLRSEDEVRQGWTNLGEEDQANVRLYCDTNAAASADPNLGTSTSSSDSAAAGMAPDSDAAGADTTGAVSGSGSTSGSAATDPVMTGDPAATQTASMRQLCDWIAETE